MPISVEESLAPLDICLVITMFMASKVLSREELASAFEVASSRLEDNGCSSEVARLSVESISKAIDAIKGIESQK